jgi:arabinan endo-1,5-alpha-L-arabinosidase
MGIPSLRSKDLTNWSYGPPVFTNPPAWTTNTVRGNRGFFWAPDALRVGDRYFLYYSVSTWGKNTSAIGLATNPTLDPEDSRYGWSDGGLVVQTTSQDPCNAIDPSVMLDQDGRLWLAFGSYWTGIKLLELDARTGLRSPTNSAIYALAWNQSIEAACLCRHTDRYYLFVNWGQCCRGTNSTYEIRVGRSVSITGPYLDRDGKDMLKGGGSLVLASSGFRIGPGHAGILRDDGREFFSYHFYHGENRGRSMLELAPLRWSADGWPEVEAALAVRQN